MRRFSGRKVLLVEDSLISAVHTESILKNWGLKIDIVRTAKEAVQKVKDNEYSILFMAVQTPDTDGLEAAKQIRLLGHNMKDLPILALTARAISMGLLNMNGVNDIILKPFSAEDIESKLNQYLTSDL